MKRIPVRLFPFFSRCPSASARCRLRLPRRRYPDRAGAEQAGPGGALDRVQFLRRGGGRGHLPLLRPILPSGRVPQHRPGRLRDRPQHRREHLRELRREHRSRVEGRSDLVYLPAVLTHPRRFNPITKPPRGSDLFGARGPCVYSVISMTLLSRISPVMASMWYLYF